MFTLYINVGIDYNHYDGNPHNFGSYHPRYVNYNLQSANAITTTSSINASNNTNTKDNYAALSPNSVYSNSNSIINASNFAGMPIISLSALEDKKIKRHISNNSNSSNCTDSNIMDKITKSNISSKSITPIVEIVIKDIDTKSIFTQSVASRRIILDQVLGNVFDTTVATERFHFNSNIWEELDPV